MTDELPTLDQLLADPELAVLHALGAARAATQRALQARWPTPMPDPAATPPTAEQPQALSWRELLLRLTGIDVTRCQKCGGTILSIPLPSVRPKDTS